MGEERYWGEQTAKAIENFGKGNLPAELIRAYGEVKKACILAINETEGYKSSDIFEALLDSVDFVINGSMNDQFPLSLYQGGAGTSINMNMNEVVASLANDLLKKNSSDSIVDPIETVNRYQSTNDTFSTAVTIVLYRKLEILEKSVILLQELLITKENEYERLVITGRTEMQSGLPITLGQVFGGWAGSIERDRWRLNKLKERIRTIALGGTAIGTGFFAPREFVYSTEKHLRQITGLPLSRSQNLPDEISNQDKLSELASGIRLVTDNLFKITGDLLLYTSSFIGEIKHPHLQYGSTIMPAKNNPVILELVKGLSIEISYETDKIREFCRNGQLQLNAYLPFILNGFIKGFDLAEMAIERLVNGFLNKFEVNPESIEKNLMDSGILLNVMVPKLGYKRVKDIYTKIKGIRCDSFNEYKELLIKECGLTESEAGYFLNPINATKYLKI